LQWCYFGEAGVFTQGHTATQPALPLMSLKSQTLESGGDIDNRIKTLFDALHVPKNCSEVQGAPEDSEKPFYCLLEDDTLITGVQVRTDRLLIPIKDGQRETDVMLIVHVFVKMRRWTVQNMQLV
jgi:hypothetical protein